MITGQLPPLLRNRGRFARRAGVSLALLATGTACRDTTVVRETPPPVSAAPAPPPTATSAAQGPTRTRESVPTTLVILDPTTTTTLVILPPVETAPPSTAAPPVETVPPSTAATPVETVPPGTAALPVETVPPETAPPEWDLFVTGRAALSFGMDEPRINPDTGTTNWNTYCLGWVHSALRAQGVDPWELQAGTAIKAYRRAEQRGRLSYGNPPAGAIVFFPEMGSLGHTGISNGDGTYRGTMPPKENPRTIGDRPIKNLESVAWMVPL